jgi:hypothetical protein
VRGASGRSLILARVSFDLGKLSDGGIASGDIVFLSLLKPGDTLVPVPEPDAPQEKRRVQSLADRLAGLLAVRLRFRDSGPHLSFFIRLRFHGSHGSPNRRPHHPSARLMRLLRGHVERRTVRPMNTPRGRSPRWQWWFMITLGALWTLLGVFELLTGSDAFVWVGSLVLGIGMLLVCGIYVGVKRRPSEAAIARADARLDSRKPRT